MSLPEGWRLTTVGESCEIRSGGTPRKSRPDFWGGEISWASAKDLKVDRIESTQLTITPAALSDSSTKLAPVGSVLMLVRGMGLANGLQMSEVAKEMAFNQDVRALIPSKDLLPRFLFLALRNHGLGSLISSAAHGTLKIDADRLRALPIPLPPLAEQRRIVAVLDAAFAGLATAEANTRRTLTNARELFESSVDCALGDDRLDWRSCTLADLGSIQTGTTPKKSTQVPSEDGIAFVKPGDFLPSGELAAEGNRLDPAALEKPRVVPQGSVLMVCIGATIGKVAVSREPVITNQQVNALTPRDSIRSSLLYYQMLRPRFQERVLAKAGQATLPIINKSKWSSLSVRVLEDQSYEAAIVEELDEMLGRSEEIVGLQARKLTALATLKQSLLHRAFCGELTGGELPASALNGKH